MQIEKLHSLFDDLSLETAVSIPETAPKAVIVFSHGMAEHKERYFPFMEYLTGEGYVCAIHDHRGHGQSVKAEEDYGYFYTEDEAGIVEDLHMVITEMKTRYPELPCYLFSHSMGTLVARCYLKKYDSEIDKLVLCGPPTQNSAVGAGLFLASVCKHFFPEKKSNHLLDSIAFAGYNKGNNMPFGWLSTNEENVTNYIADPLCGFIFTTNGFINLFKLQKGAFAAADWTVSNPKLPILVIAGEKDPVIQSDKSFLDLLVFLRTLGYQNLMKHLYKGLRHEILNESGKEKVWSDVLRFFEDSI